MSTTAIDGDHARIGRLRPIVERILIVAIGAVLLILDVGGFNRNTDYYSLNIWNVLVDPFYPGTHQDDVTVLILTDEDLKQLKTTYPPSAALHARVLRALTAQQPRAVMIDLIFSQERDDPGIVELMEAMRSFRATTGSPVYLAAIAGDGGERLPLRREMEALIADGVAVPVSIVRSNRSWLAQVYHLRYPSRPPALDSAALALYSEYCRNQPCARSAGGDFVGDMYIIWSSDIAPFNLAAGCPERPSLTARLSGVAFGVFPELDCTYTPFLDVTTLLAAEIPDSGVRGRIRGRLVLYGAALTGVSDIVTPAFHRALPGVFAHAMALDNLLTWNDRHYRESIEGWEILERLKLFEIVTLSLVLFAPLAARPVFKGTRWGGAIEKIVAADPKPARRSAMIWSLPLALQRWLRSLIPGAILMLAVIGFEVFVLNIVPLNWVGVFAIAVLGELAERPTGPLVTFLLFVLFSPRRRLLASALFDAKVADAVRAELRAIDQSARHG